MGAIAFQVCFVDRLKLTSFTGPGIATVIPINAVDITFLEQFILFHFFLMLEVAEFIIFLN
jgi:hypothetical protein